MDCAYFDGCSAPLCPRDEGIAERAWFADEDICRLAAVPEWVKRQRKVSRQAALGSSPSGYFTLAMLKQDCRICKGIKGIESDGTDRERTAGETAWFKAHPVITAEEREKNRVLALKNRAFLPGVEAVTTTPEQGLNAVSGKKGT